MTIKNTYLRDPENDKRVLTVVREFDPKTRSVRYGWSMNSPSYWEPYETSRFKGERRVPGDVFSRKEGRRMALERLNNDPVFVEVSEGELPLVAVLNNLSHNFNVSTVVNRIAKHYSFKIKNEKITEEEKFKSFVSWVKGIFSL